jgi:hypothetical protein
VGSFNPSNINFHTCCETSATGSWSARLDTRKRLNACINGHEIIAFCPGCNPLIRAYRLDREMTLVAYLYPSCDLWHDTMIWNGKLKIYFKKIRVMVEVWTKLRSLFTVLYRTTKRKNRMFGFSGLGKSWFKNWISFRKKLIAEQASARRVIRARVRGSFEPVIYCTNGIPLSRSATFITVHLACNLRESKENKR